jgi:hypothetical protein
VDCDKFSDVAAELALGVLTGRERAEAVPQLDRCDACREDVRELAFTGEELLKLLPEVTPPAGFAYRMQQELCFSGKRRLWGVRGRGGRPRPRVARVHLLVAAAAAAVVLAVGGGLGGWAVRGGAGSGSMAGAGVPAAGAAPGAGAGAAPGAATLHPATLTTAQHQVIGRVFLDNQGYLGSDGWVYVSVDSGTGNGTVVCQLLGQDGRVTTIGSFGLDGGYGYWGSPESMRGTTVVGARLLAKDGHVLASATFGS